MENETEMGGRHFVFFLLLSAPRDDEEYLMCDVSVLSLAFFLPLSSGCFASCSPLFVWLFISFFPSVCQFESNTQESRRFGEYKTLLS